MYVCMCVCAYISLFSQPSKQVRTEYGIPGQFDRLKVVHIRTYIHRYIHAYIHICLYSHMHTYIQTINLRHSLSLDVLLLVRTESEDFRICQLHLQDPMQSERQGRLTAPTYIHTVHTYIHRYILTLTYIRAYTYIYAPIYVCT
jgi:hypothetical protein